MSRVKSNSVCVCGVDARVARNTPICPEHVELELVLAEFPASQPGQFLQLQCAARDDHDPRVAEWAEGGFPSLAYAKDWGEGEPFLRRPFSIADQWRDADEQTHVLVISRTVGRGTGWLAQLRPGESLNITGPLGHGFEIPPRDVSLALVGGGVGIPPLLYLARRLNELGRRNVTVVFGARTRHSLPVRLIGEPATDGQPRPCVELPGTAPYLAMITTDDGSVGMRGLVTDAFAGWYAHLPDPARKDATVFACGPAAMLAAVANLTRADGLGCQLCIERKMGCGLGTCLSCVVQVRDTSRSEGWRWALTCVDGPVFDRDELVEYM
jgi:dihydroorotate dehydrogenase electron transfer subunit